MKETVAIPLVADFLRSKSLNPERITPEMYPPGSMRTDFRVTWGDGGLFFCEVKSPELKLNSAMEVFKHSTTMSKLRDMLHTSTKQFKSLNPRHLVPNVLIWTSDHFQLNFTNFIDCFRGIISFKKEVIRDFRNSHFVTRTQYDWLNIDMHIWLQVGDNGIYEEKYFLNENSHSIAYRLFRILIV